VSTDRGIILYDNHMTNLSICYGFNSPRYIVKGEVNFDRDAPLKAVGIEIFKDHSSPRSILERHISLDEKHFNDSSTEIYVQHTSVRWKMELVLNITLLPEHSNAFIRAWAIFFEAGKLVSNSTQLPTIYNSSELDNITYNVWINDKYVNVLDCYQEIDESTIAILFNITSSSNITCILQVGDGNKVKNITNDVTTVINVTLLNYKTEQILHLSFQCCLGNQTNFTCKLHK
ncbi:polymorphic transmembrane cluster 2 transmembrane protein 1, partial [Biomphalaria glabrata]